LELEAARALEEAEEGGRAGELYEALGLLHKAAAAYERSGEISRLELVLEVLERLDERQAARRALIREVDDAVAQGQRRYAHELLREHTHARRSEIAYGTPAPAGLVSRLQLLESKLLRRDRVDLRWGTNRVTAIRGAPRMRIGRAPDSELPLPGALLSRHHVELSVETRGDHPRLVATDLGSKVGSFWEGEPMLAGEPMIIDGPGELGLGTATAIEVHPVTADHGALGGLVRPVGTQRWTLFLPAGGPLWLAPDIRVPATILFDRGYVVLDLAGRVAAYLGDAPLSPGSCMELMVGDRVRLAAAPLTLEVLA
jgi:hypothetical protein